MIGKFTNNSGKGTKSEHYTKVREEDVQLQENYENMGITVYDMNIYPKFHNQKDINFFLYKDLYFPGTFWKPIIGGDGSIFANGKFFDGEEYHRNRTFGRPIVVYGETTVFIDPSFEARIYKTTDDKLTISIDIEGIEPVVYENSPAGTMFVVTYGTQYVHGNKPFIAEYRPYSYKELAKKDI
jgi:hypothetical protein